MERSETTYHIIPIRDEFLIEVWYGDGYTRSTCLGGYFKKRHLAQTYLDDFKKMMTMSYTGRMIMEMEEMGIEPINENIPQYLEIKKKEEQDELRNTNYTVKDGRRSKDISRGKS
jgi:hypothetical protein